jgi:hypothetical protein
LDSLAQKTLQLNWILTLRLRSADAWLTNDLKTKTDIDQFDDANFSLTAYLKPNNFCSFGRIGMN